MCVVLSSIEHNQQIITIKLVIVVGAVIVIFASFFALGFRQPLPVKVQIS